MLVGGRGYRGLNAEFDPIAISEWVEHFDHCFVQMANWKDVRNSAMPEALSIAPKVPGMDGSGNEARLIMAGAGSSLGANVGINMSRPLKQDALKTTVSTRAV